MSGTSNIDKFKIKSDLEVNGFSLINDFWDFKKLYRVECQLESLMEFHLNEFKLKEIPSDICAYLAKNKPNAIGEIYDSISYSDSFLNLISGDLADLIRIILDLPLHNPLYSWQHRVLMQLPQCKKRLSNWHQETFYTIPFSLKYLQCWFPLFCDSSPENGTIWILPQSHKEGYALSNVKYPEEQIMQITVDPSVIDKYKPMQISVKRGDIILFNGATIHKSGQNLSNQTRFSVVGMFHDLLKSQDARVPQPTYKYRGISPLEWHKKVFSS